MKHRPTSIRFDLTNPGASYRTAAFGAFGNIALAKSNKSGVSSNVNIDGPGGGRIVIRGRKLAVSGESSIRADNSNSSQAGGDVTIKVDHLSVSGSAASGEQSKIEVTTTGDGAGGNLQIDAGSVAISEGATIRVETPGGLGNAGKLTLNADGSVTLTGGGVPNSIISTAETIRP